MTDKQTTIMENITYTLRSCIKSIDYSTRQLAESAKDFIDKYGCCGVCGKKHFIQEIKSND